LLPALVSINDVFLGTRLVLEVLSLSSLPWMAYYERLGDSYVACSLFGIAGEAPALSHKLVHEAQSAGYILFLDQKSQLLQLFDGHVFLIPESSQIPPEISDEVRRISMMSIFSKGTFRLYPQDKLSSTSAHELIHLGLSRNFQYGSFFILNSELLIGKSVTFCPNAISDLINNELRSIALSVLGSSGHALGMRNNTCFCVFYSHTVIDTELIVTQVARTLLRSIGVKDSELSLIGPWYSTKLSDERSEFGLSTFIQSIEPRLQV